MKYTLTALVATVAAADGDWNGKSGNSWEGKSGNDWKGKMISWETLWKKYANDAGEMDE